MFEIVGATQNLNHGCQTEQFQNCLMKLDYKLPPIQMVTAASTCEHLSCHCDDGSGTGSTCYIIGDGINEFGKVREP